LYTHGWLGQLIRRWEDRIFATEDTAARARGWQLSHPPRGLGRIYRDPRWDLISAGEACGGDGGNPVEPCLPCAGHGTVRRDWATAPPGGAS
jgi:hypothetical protein